MGPSIFIDGDLHHRAGDQFHPRQASMGPSIFIDGDVTERAAAWGFSQLQWGRRSSSTETVMDLSGSDHYVYRLQWGRRSSSTETTPPRSPASSPVTLQWGRRSSSTETRVLALRPPRGRRFNGAVDLHRRRR